MLPDRDPPTIARAWRHFVITCPACRNTFTRALPIQPLCPNCRRHLMSWKNNSHGRDTWWSYECDHCQWHERCKTDLGWASCPTPGCCFSIQAKFIRCPLTYPGNLHAAWLLAIRSLGVPTSILWLFAVIAVLLWLSRHPG